MSAGPLVVIGDALLDVDVCGQVLRECPDAPAPVLDVGEDADRVRPGGAALAALLTAADVDETVELVSALAEDPAEPGTARLVDALGPGVRSRPLPWTGTLPTKTRLRDGDATLARVDRGDLRAPDGPGGEVPAEVAAAIERAGALLVSDYGRGVTAHPGLRRLVTAAARRVPVVWDPHPRGAPPVRGVTVVCPNHDEAAAVCGHRQAGTDPAAAGARARRLRRHWGARAVAVTLGAAGALVVDHEEHHLVPVPAGPGATEPADTCGAGDRFAAGVLVALADGAGAVEASRYGVARAAAYVRGGGASALRRDEAGAWLVPGDEPDLAPDPTSAARPVALPDTRSLATRPRRPREEWTDDAHRAHDRVG